MRPQPKVKSAISSGISVQVISRNAEFSKLLPTWLVVATLLLDLKTTLHGWLAKVEERELSALLRLLLISVVVLPFLPNRNFGPWQALNPYALWWMVVLISAISFCGYVAVKLLGQRRGLALTALFSGLTSSTALTLHFSRLARQQPANGTLLAGGILFSCAAMLPRTLVVTLVLHPDLARALLLPFTVMEILILLPALYWWYRANHSHVLDTGRLSNPVELKAALGFGLLLSLVVLVSAAARQLIGDEALLAVALISGIADVDAITVSLSRLSVAQVSLTTALTGIVLAAASNNVSKATMAVLIGGKATGWRYCRYGVDHLAALEWFIASGRIFVMRATTAAASRDRTQPRSSG